jgi:hypothetical protein
MNKTIVALVVVVLVALGVYVVSTQTPGISDGPADSSLATYRSPELGFEFQYREGADGYVLKELAPPTSDAGLVRTIVLTPAADAATPPPAGGEGPATITISVFTNAARQWPRTWADEYLQYSNINLSQNEVEERVVGGANAIRYMADGLYASENIVVAHGEHMYVFTGMFIDADSRLRADFAPLIESVRFIPQPGQE